jgi:hypothetical protein
MKTKLIALANEDRENLVGLANEFAVGEDGWVRIAPYGDSIKERETRQPDGSVRAERFVQRFTPEAGAEMARRGNSLWGKIRRFRVGVPIYRRHPDLAKHSPNTVQAAPSGPQAEHGVFADLDARADGLYGRPVLTAAGQHAIENEGMKYLSPFWWTKKLGEENGATIVEPVELISAGLTDRPNIAGGEALANQKDSETKKQEESMKKRLIELLGLLGVALANEADEAAVEAGVAAAMEKAKASADAATALANEKTALDAGKAEAEAKLATEQAAHAATQTALANERTAREAAQAKATAERKARIDLVLDQAVAAGRITPAERPTWATALANETEFDAKSAELARAAGKVKTASAIGDIGGRKGEATLSKGAQIVALANERLKDFGNDWDQAYASVRKSHPALFDGKAAE